MLLYSEPSPLCPRNTQRRHLRLQCLPEVTRGSQSWPYPQGPSLLFLFSLHSGVLIGFGNK